MAKIARDEDGYIIEKDGVRLSVAKAGWEPYPAGSIFIVLGVFTLFEYSDLIDRSCEIFVVEEEKEFEEYLGRIAKEAGFVNVKLIKGGKAAFVREHFSAGRAADAARVRILRNREIYSISREKYAAALADINAALSEIKKSDWINSAEQLMEEMDKAVDGEKEVLALMSLVLSGE